MKIGKRMAQGLASAKEWLIQYAYLVTLGAAVAVVVAAALYTDHVKRGQAALEAAAQAVELEAAPSPQSSVTPLPTIAPLMFSQMIYTPYRATVRPVSGRIIRAYEQEPVFWEALGVMKSHQAIDIAAQAEESVLCVMDGVVKKTVMDALWGWRVHVAHTDGSEGEYAGLALTYVSPDSSVTRGQEIGVLLEQVPCEAELGPHLHFELRKNGVLQDPEGILPE